MPSQRVKTFPEKKPMDKQSVIIVGGGVIGINAAYVIDRDGLCKGTSSGNAAALAFSDVLPMAHKGMLKNVPRWLMDPLGPLSIPPAYLPTILPWLLRLVRESSPSKRARSVAAQVAMMRLAETETLALAARAGIEHMIRNDGSLELYSSEAAFQDALAGWELRKKHGVPFEHVRGERLAQLQPGLSPSIVAATFSPAWRTVSNPFDYAMALWSYAEKLGAKFTQGRVKSLDGFGEKAMVRLDNGQTLQADYVINAAGAWSHKLAETIGETIPLETERGYNTTLPTSAFNAKCMLIFSSDGFVLTPLSNGVRIGGAVELAGLDRAPNYKRSEAMLQKAKRYLPELDTTGGTQWVGYRPSLPDTLPAIGRSKKSPRIFHAFGHGHLGLTQSAATGRLLRELITGGQPPIDLTPFNPQRF
jgi:D-amino-acid dehydrogenase